MTALPRPAIGFVPTPTDAVTAMVDLADLRPGDRVYDLGCGDGRLLIEAAVRGRSLGLEGVGIDVDGALLDQARARAIAAGVGDRLRWRQADLFATDLGEATVVFIYLLPHLNLRLRPRLRQLRPGSRIVTHLFTLGDDWPPDRTQRLPNSEEESVIHLWQIS